VDKFEDGIVMLPMNATEGWKLVVDGAIQNVIKVVGCFVGLEVGAG
jgi:uncharacterized membrane protein YfhO